LIANVAKMVAPLIRQGLDWRALIIVLAFIGVAVMRWPLVFVLAVLAPASIAIAWFKR
jgi:chromate transporter